jgi:preprotein translocase subunit SecA
MDHLRGGIGLRGFAERDPKVAFKLEGTKLFEEMIVGVREKVTDMVFKVRLRAGERMTSAYRVSQMVHEQLSGYDHLTQGIDMAAASQPKGRPDRPPGPPRRTQRPLPLRKRQEV